MSNAQTCEKKNLLLIIRESWRVDQLLLLLLLFFFNFYFLTLGTYDPEGDEKLRKLIYKLGYDHQSVRSVDGKLLCRKTAL